jgi:hypothetical protein
MIANMNDNQLVQVATEVISLEAAAVNGLLVNIGDNFVQACQLPHACHHNPPFTCSNNMASLNKIITNIY